MTEPSSPKELEAACPRCGYDQRGVIATWTESCPLHGTCSECGLELNWRTVFQPTLYPPRWCVEFASSFAWLPMRACQTLAMMCMPWKFWSQMRMHHPVRLARIIVIYLILLWLVIALWQWFECYHGWYPLRPYLSSIDDLHWSILNYPQPSIPEAPALFVPMAFASIIIPAAFIFLPTSRRIAKVQHHHIFRIAMYSWTILFLVLLLDLARPFILDNLIASRIGTSRQRWFWYRDFYWWLVVAGIPAFLCCWWACAIHFYLRMKHATSVAICLFLLAALVTLFGLFLSLALSDW